MSHILTGYVAPAWMIRAQSQYERVVAEADVLGIDPEDVIAIIQSRPEPFDEALRIARKVVIDRTMQEP
jgi:hypothetical protein